MSKEDTAKCIKIILLGESGVGKTNLIRVASGEEFEQNSMTSSSGSYKEGIYISTNKKKYLYHLWDTAGQEVYRSLNKIFIKNAQIVIFVFAIDNETSFTELNYWIDLAKTELGDDFVKGMVANKIDLYEEQQVKEEDSREFAKQQNIKYRATSALTEPTGFKSFLEELIVEYIKKVDPVSGEEGITCGGTIENSFTLKKMGQKHKKKGGCCS
jgi:small GTP-binding protein